MLVTGNGSLQSGSSAPEFSNEREILYKLFFDMKKDVTELKKMSWRFYKTRRWQVRGMLLS